VIVAYTELPDDAGGWPRPLLDVAIADMDEMVFPCLVDSGSLNTLVPRWLAEAAGIDLPKPARQSLAVGGGTTKAAFTTVQLTAADHRWEASVAFCHPWPYSWGLLGQLSFFRYFTVAFRAADFAFEVEPLSA
jgi:hypothetical protein